MADAPAPTEIERGFQSMYNLEFDQAHQNFSAWERLHPNDPLGPVSQAAGYLFGEFARLGILESELFTNDKTFEDRAKLAPDPKVRDEFNGAVSRGDRLADAALKQNPEDTNALFAKVLALGLRSDYVALIDKQDFAALHYMKQGRILAQQLLKQKPDDYDAMLAVGVENYLTGIKPAPIRWMLSLGGIDPNKEQGLANRRPRKSLKALRQAPARSSCPARQEQHPWLRPAASTSGGVSAQRPLPQRSPGMPLRHFQTQSRRDG